MVVNLDNQKYRVYELNFSEETVRLVEKYNFNDRLSAMVSH